MSDDLDFDMEVVEDDELDELGADGVSSSKKRSRGRGEEFEEEPTKGGDLEKEAVGTEKVDSADSRSEKKYTDSTSSSRDDNHITGFGHFPSDWQKKRVAKCAEIRDSERIPLNSSEREEMQPGDIPYYGANGVVDFINGYIFDSELILLAEDGGHFEEYQNRPVAYRVSGKAWINNHAHILEAEDGVNTEYLFYSLEHRNLVPYVSGSTRSKLTQSMLRKVRVPVPSLPEQRKIASVLSAVDQAIQKTEAIIEQAKRVKRGLMLDLLTQGMKDRPSKRVRVGPKEFSIPQNWSLVSLEEVTSKITDGTHESPSKKDEGYPLITAKHVTGGEIDYGSSYLISKEAHEKVIQRSNPEKGDILFTHIGTLGEVVRVKEEKEFSIKNVALFKPDRDKILPEYLEYCLQGELVQNFIDRLSQGGVQSFLSLTLFRQFEVPLPPLEEQAEIVEVLNSVDKEIRGSKEQKERLQRLKKGLMQDLLTGEVRTADKAIDVLEEVAAYG